MGSNAGGGGGYPSSGGRYPWQNDYNPTNQTFRNRFTQQKAGSASGSGSGSGSGSTGNETGTGSTGSVGGSPDGPPPVNPGAPAVVNPDGISTKGNVSTQTLGKGAGVAPGSSYGSGVGMSSTSSVIPNGPGSAGIARQGGWSRTPGGNDFNRQLTDDEFKSRWDDLESRAPVQNEGGRSDLPTWGEFFAQSGQAGMPMDRNAYRNSVQGPMVTPGAIPRMPGKEMQKWKGGKYVGNGTWEAEGAGNIGSGGRPSGNE